MHCYIVRRNSGLATHWNYLKPYVFPVFTLFTEQQKEEFSSLGENLSVLQYDRRKHQIYYSGKKQLLISTKNSNFVIVQSYFQLGVRSDEKI